MHGRENYKPSSQKVYSAATKFGFEIRAEENYAQENSFLEKKYTRYAVLSWSGARM